MKSVLLIGLGRFGRSMAMKLGEMGHHVMAVDKDEDRVNEILPLVTDAQIGDASSERFLRSLGVGNYDVCFVAIGDGFQSSLEVTSLLKDLGAVKVISRASSAVHRKFLLRNGADDVVYPERQLGEWTAVRYTTDHVLDFIALDDQYSIYEITAPDEWAGKSISSLDVRRRYGLNILVIREADGTSTPVSPETILAQDQIILVLGTWKNIRRCLRG